MSLQTPSGCLVVSASAPVPGGHYHEYPGGNALGIDSIPQMLPGGQYAIGQVPGRSEVTVSSLRWRLILNCLRQLFCFDAFLSACGQTRRMGMVRQESSLTWLSMRVGLQGRKPGESNKLFDLFYRHRTLIRPIRSIRG